MQHRQTITPSLLWVPPRIDPVWQKQIVDAFNIHPTIAQIFISRGFKSLDEIHHYLYAQLPDLFDPFLMVDMDKAVQRIIHALTHNEPVLIYGDNDVDGVTGTTLLVEFLRYIGLKVYFYVPHHSKLRQNVMIEALNYALKYRCRLMITVDHGITAATEIQQVINAGIDVIVTDHHEPTDRLPNCIATLNPKLLNSPYPNRDLTGVGVAFKLAHATTSQFVEQGLIPANKVDLKYYLDLVALGTIADMGSLLGENRILVKYGLHQLRKGKRLGFVKLINLCGIPPAELTSSNLVAKVIPQLNSLGRIANARKGIELLLMRNARAAELLAHEIGLNNAERQKIERTIALDVEQYIRTHPEVLNEKAIILSSEAWHPGVIAIIVTRIMRMYNRPTAMIAIENGIGKGSLRTIREFPLLPTLKKSRYLFLNFGGHDFAAGLTIKPENIEAFKTEFIRATNEQLHEQDIKPKLNIDATLQFNELSFEFMDNLSLLEPYGNDNPPPVFCSEAKQTWPPKIISKDHLRMYLEQNGLFLEGIAFSMAHRAPSIRQKGLMLGIAFTPHINNYQNKLSIQLLIRDVKSVDE